MRHLYATVLALALCTQAAHAQQPFERLGVKVPVLRLSNGRYPEFFPNDSLRRVGSVVYNRRLHRIAYLLPADSLNRPPAEVTSRWFSPDPLAEKEMYSSPYVFVNDNPVNKFDPDGRSGIASIDRKNHTITVSSTMVYYGPSANAQVAKSSAADMQNAWNAAKGHVFIGGHRYSVAFKVTGVYRDDLTKKEVESNTSYANNYIKVNETNINGTIKNASEMDGIGSNTGIFVARNIKADGSTTEAHEAGHGYGEEHSSDDFRGKGRPDIMAPRGALGDMPFQYNPGMYSGLPGGAINPETREVTQENIENLGLQNLNYDKNGNANVGALTNQYHESDR